MNRFGLGVIEGERSLGTTASSETGGPDKPMSVFDHISPKTKTYTYPAQVVAVIDGDTVWFDVDVGLETKRLADGRFFGINTLEKTGPQKAEGLKAKAFVEAQLPVGLGVTITTIKVKDKDKHDKYGRYLVIIKLPDGSILNDTLVQNGMAKEYYP